MSVDFNNLLFNGASAVPPEQQVQLAAALRNKEQMATVMGLTGDRVLAPQGEQMANTADKMRQQAIIREYYNRQMEQAELNRETSMRGQDMDFDKAQMMMETQERVAGIRGAKRGKITPTEAEPIIEGVNAIQYSEELRNSWNPEWQSKVPGVNWFRNTLTRGAPALASEGMIEEQAWRARFANLIEASIRHKLYGAALTENELKTWRAQTINMAANPKQVENWFNQLIRANETTLKHRLSVAAYNYGPEAVQALTLGINPNEGSRVSAPAPGGIPGPQQQMYEVVQ